MHMACQRGLKLISAPEPEVLQSNASLAAFASLVAQFAPAASAAHFQGQRDGDDEEAAADEELAPRQLIGGASPIDQEGLPGVEGRATLLSLSLSQSSISPLRAVTLHHAGPPPPHQILSRMLSSLFFSLWMRR